MLKLQQFANDLLAHEAEISNAVRNVMNTADQLAAGISNYFKDHPNGIPSEILTALNNHTQAINATPLPSLPAQVVPVLTGTSQAAANAASPTAASPTPQQTERNQSPD